MQTVIESNKLFHFLINYFDQNQNTPENTVAAIAHGFHLAIYYIKFEGLNVCGGVYMFTFVYTRTRTSWKVLNMIGNAM